MRFAGKESAVYRLTVTDGPYVAHTFPAGARRGAKTELRLLGWNLTNNTAIIDAPETAVEAATFSFCPSGAGRPSESVQAVSEP